MDRSRRAGFFNPSGVETLFRSMTTGSVASRRNPWLFVFNRNRGISVLTGKAGSGPALRHFVRLETGGSLQSRSFASLRMTSKSTAERAEVAVVLRYLGAIPCARPCLKGRHAGLPLRLRAVPVFRPLLVMNLSFTFPDVIPAKAGIQEHRQIPNLHDGSPPARG
jgi:hypothetical protein